MKKTLIAIALTGIAWFAVAADAPKIDEARIDAAMEQFSGQVHGAAIPEEARAEMRQQVIKELQKAEVIKNHALKAGLDKNPSVQNQLKNLEAQFYANQYVDHLRKTIAVSESDMRSLYERLGREVKVQMAVFSSEADAKQGLEKLRKGMSFADLVKSLPEQPETPDEFISTQMLPPELAQEVDSMDKGKISSVPIVFQGAYVLVKVADARKKKGGLPSFEQLKPRLQAQKQDEILRQKIRNILAEYGLE